MDLLKNLNNIFSLRTHILIAGSGGLDSMVLLDILQKTKLYISVVHANFQLRYSDSNEDEFFIKEFCKQKRIPFYKKKFNTINYSINKKKSIQIAARNQRYGWFFRILKNIEASYIILGHHLDDTIETFFINLLRSSSLKGIISIPEISKFLLRPLLPFIKTKILQYAKKNNIWWREDISNKNYKYLRNMIRNDLITYFYDRNSKTLLFLREDYMIIQQSISNTFKNITINFVKTNFCWEINTILFKKKRPFITYLYKVLYPYGFNNLSHTSTGKQFFSKSYRLLNDRNRLVIIKQQERHKRYAFYFEVNDFMNQEAIVSIDFDLVLWPIFFSKWKKGYFFLYSFSKKISKLFQEKKLNFFEKEEILILVNADDQIICIINLIFNYFFKITLKTNLFLNIYYQ